MEQGDEIELIWSAPESVLYVEYPIFTVSDLLSEEFDEKGFNIPPSRKGVVLTDIY